MEEVLEAEEAEGNYLQDQIADYEAWEESTFRPTTSIDSVLCPICQCSYLVAIGNNISCSDSCSFRIDVASPDRPLCLLREDLSQVYKEHSGCSCNLSFEVIKSKTLRNQLFVCCHLCGLAKSFEY